MALAQLCAWHYGLEPFDVSCPDRVRLLRAGDIISRRAMPGVSALIRKTVGMLHFGCIVYCPPFPEVEDQQFGEVSPTMKRERNIQRAKEMLQMIQVVHYSKDKPRRICKVVETNMLYFVYEKLVPENVLVRHRFEGNNVYVLWSGEDVCMRETIVRRAKHSVGMTDYNLFSRNCEHWAQKILYDRTWNETQSVQIQAGVVFLVLLLILMFVIVWKKSA
jgi:hypothetical protein